MNPVIVGAVVGAAVTMFGWLANHRLTLHQKHQQQRLDFESADRTQRLMAAIRHLEAQLHELYGPLAFCDKEGERAFHELLHALGRNHVFKNNTIPPDDRETWYFWVDKFFLPNNERICALLRDKAHLIEGVAIPASFQEFLDYHYSWKLHHERYKEHEISYSGHARSNWPTAFSAEIRRTFEALKTKHSRFLAELEGLKPAVTAATPLA